MRNSPSIFWMVSDLIMDLSIVETFLTFQWESRQAGALLVKDILWFDHGDDFESISHMRLEEDMSKVLGSPVIGCPTG